MKIYKIAYANDDTPPPEPTPKPEPVPGKMFNQEEVNAILAEERKKAQKTIDQQVTTLEGLKKTAGLTEKQKQELQARIEELTTAAMTKEQLAARERERLQNEHKTQAEILTKERDEWKNRFVHSSITRDLLAEAAKAEAFSPQQLVALLSPSARITEVLDGEGNPIPGEFTVKIKLPDKDKNGAPVVLDLSISDALKRMKDRPAEFGNLFKSGLNGGLGGNNGGGGGSVNDKDNPPTDPEAYREWRKKHGRGARPTPGSPKR